MVKRMRNPVGYRVKFRSSCEVRERKQKLRTELPHPNHHINNSSHSHQIHRLHLWWWWLTVGWGSIPVMEYINRCLTTWARRFCDTHLEFRQLRNNFGVLRMNSKMDIVVVGSKFCREGDVRDG